MEHNDRKRPAQPDEDNDAEPATEAAPLPAAVQHHQPAPTSGANASSPAAAALPATATANAAAHAAPTSAADAYAAAEAAADADADDFQFPQIRLAAAGPKAPRRVLPPVPTVTFQPSTVVVDPLGYGVLTFEATVYSIHDLDPALVELEILQQFTARGAGTPLRLQAELVPPPSLAQLWAKIDQCPGRALAGGKPAAQPTTPAACAGNRHAGGPPT